MSTARTPIRHVSAWRGADLEAGRAVSFDLRTAQIAAFDRALDQVQALGLSPPGFAREHFPLPGLDSDLAALSERLVAGEGIVLIRGFPVERWSQAEIEAAYWGLGTHLGHAVPQSLMGDYLGHVKDVSGKDPNQRAYRNSLAIPMHNDWPDLVGMLSIRAAREGGLSSYASMVAVHNEMLATRPELLEPLYRGFRYHRFDRRRCDEPPVTDYRIPVFSLCEGALSGRIVPEYIDMAEVELGEPLAPVEREAIDCFLAVAERDDVRLDIMLQPGEASFINNHFILHARSAFYDEDPARGRYLLRLWLQCPGRPTRTDLRAALDQWVPQPTGATDTYYSGETARIANRGRYGESSTIR